MTRDEYEERKRRIEEQHRSGIELLEAARRQQLRALDLVWMTTAAGDVDGLGASWGEAAFQPLAVGGPERLTIPAAPPDAPSALPPRRLRRAFGEFIVEIEGALARVPEVFDRNDVTRVLGYEPDRGSLFRVLQELAQEGSITVVTRGEGRHPTRYRKVATEAPDDTD